jgi:ParB-like chromosome segregation protein Spo0J
VAQIAASIREFGFVDPILVAPNGGIIAGEGRWRAAQSEGVYRVPMIVLQHLSEVQRRALAIADNQLAPNASWDETGYRAQKPVELMRRLIRNHTRPGEACYDPFLGSGSTLIAA